MDKRGIRLGFGGWDRFFQGTVHLSMQAAAFMQGSDSVRTERLPGWGGVRGGALAPVH